MLKRTVMAGAVAAALGSGLAQAAEPASPHTLTGNVGLYSQYIFRGLTQTNREPALQGGFDYSHSSGFYLGTWASNISWLRDGPPAAAGGPAYNAGGSLEWDFFGGWKWGFAPDWTLDLGALYYWYPGDVAPGFVKGRHVRDLRGRLLEVVVGEVFVQRGQQDLRPRQQRRQLVPRPGDQYPARRLRQGGDGLQHLRPLGQAGLQGQRRDRSTTTRARTTTGRSAPRTPCRRTSSSACSTPIRAARTGRATAALARAEPIRATSRRARARSTSRRRSSGGGTGGCRSPAALFLRAFFRRRE